MPSAFQIPEDIANRALQHIGAERITLFTDGTKNSDETAFAYDRLRQAELRDNIWRFALRRCVLRAITSTTKSYTPPVYASGTTYPVGAIVSYNNGQVTEVFQSVASSNIGNVPGRSTQWTTYGGPLYADAWAGTNTYLPGELAIDTTAYVCLVQSTNQPSVTPSEWVAVNGTLAAVEILYPIGTGPAEQTFTRNIYPLPNGFLREAKQDPRTGVDTSKLLYGDWLIENKFIVTRESQAVIYRYVADMVNVADFDVLFCEALAARLALELCEVFTQSQPKAGQIGQQYSHFLAIAKDTNALEEASVPMAGGFSIPEDIANRALQHLGVERIASFAENSKAADETQFVFDKLRQAELRRNVWRFSIRRSIIRALTTTTYKVTPPAWAIGTTYALGAVVSYNDGYSNKYWQTTVGGNIGNNPTVRDSGWVLYAGPVHADIFDLTTNYYPGDLVYEGTPKVPYVALVSTSNDPATTAADWTPWTGSTLALVSVLYPMEAGTVDTAFAKNQYPLPYGYLQMAPSDPKAGSISLWGSPTNRMADDYDFEGNMLVTMELQPIVIRYVADVTDVRQMDAMFCEGLACRIALACAETLAPPPTPSGPNGQMMPPRSKTVLVAQEYKQFMGEARIVNAIEIGYEEPPMDDYISTRL